MFYSDLNDIDKVLEKVIAILIFGTGGQEVKFHEIESHFFQEIERTIMRSKVLFFMRLKVSIIFYNVLCQSFILI